jgi:hypothetical protein
MSYTTDGDNVPQDMPAHVHPVQMSGISSMHPLPCEHTVAVGDAVETHHILSLLFPESSPCPHMVLLLLLRLLLVIPDMSLYHLVQHINGEPSGSPVFNTF